MSSDSLAGPMVATILVRLVTLGVTLIPVVHTAICRIFRIEVVF